MRRELHVRFCEGGGVRFPSATRRNVYVSSKRAGERVMEALRGLYADLRLRVNEAKSAVARPQDRKFLGYSFWIGPGKTIKRRVAPKALATMKDKVRQITGRNGGRSLSSVVAELRGYLVGWKEYFKLADTPRIFRDLDGWIRHRLRTVQLKQWKRGTTIFRELRARGMSVRTAAQVAAGARRWCHNARLSIHIALPNAYFDALGLPRLAA